jgi:hypothetical protein
MKQINHIILLLSLLIIIIITGILYFDYPRFLISAQEMNSQNYRIQGGNLNMTSGDKSSSSYKLSDVVGQSASIIFSSKGYSVNSGFLNSAAGTNFSFTISPINIDFGELKPKNPVEQNLTLTISNGNVPGYTVKVSESQPLSTSLGAEIPDTRCDPKTPCTPEKAAEWQNDAIYGLGYRMTGSATPLDFSRGYLYRSFPAILRNEKPATIMKSRAKKVTDMAGMSIKVNIPKEQPVGQYKNILIFTAIAGI